MGNKPSVQARCPEYQKLRKQKQVGPIGLAIAPRFVSYSPFTNNLKLVIQHVFHDAAASRVALIYDRSNTELLAFRLKHVNTV
jgi:hypothetical protein